MLLRKGEKSLPALADVRAKVEQLNESPGELLPGIKLDTVYDRTNLIELTTHTVRENVAGRHRPGGHRAVGVS